jgi:integrase
MLGTGVRIGEALATLWSEVDLEAGTVEITHTIARIPGEGLLRKTTKSKAGWFDLDTARSVRSIAVAEES